MEDMLKFKIGQPVYYMLNNKMHNAVVLARCYVDVDEDLASMPTTDHRVSNALIEFPRRMMMAEGKLFQTIYKRYATVHGEFFEHEIFASKQELADALLERVENESETAVMLQRQADMVAGRYDIR